MTSSDPGSDPEGWLRGLDPLGWRFGLERIKLLLAALDEPQRRFRSAHVVGTNGKSSVTAMLAALLEAHGRRTGAYLSPHVHRWAERIVIAGEEVPSDAFAAAAGRVARATASVERQLAPEDRVTQFEAATAVAFVALADAGVEFAVIEAGLGGRLDATNVLASEVTALTSVGLDHTAWLGETQTAIAREKLAVLRPGTVLVVGALRDDVTALAAATAHERNARLVVAPAAPPAPATLADVPYLRRNLGVALEAARVLLGELEPGAVERALAGLRLAGRAQRLDGSPPVIFDAAHNPDGAGALAEALAESDPGAPVVACLAVLADKDHRAIVAALAPALTEACCCEVPADVLQGSGRPAAAPTPAAALTQACIEHGVPARALASPEEAVEAAVERARELGGVALLAGSHYLLRYEWIARRAQNSSR